MARGSGGWADLLLVPQGWPERALKRGGWTLRPRWGGRASEHRCQVPVRWGEGCPMGWSDSMGDGGGRGVAGGGVGVAGGKRGVGEDAVLEALAEFGTGIETGFAKFDLQGGDFDEAGEIAAGADGDDDMGDGDAEDGEELLFEAEAIVVHVLGPGLEGDDEVHLFMFTDGADAEHTGDIDDTEATDLHEVMGHGVGGGLEFDIVVEAEADDIIGDEAVAAFEEGEDGFAFADAAFALDDGTDAEEVDHGGVEGGAG